MSLFSQLAETAARHGLRFLVIGGHAVIEHGFQRGTEELTLKVHALKNGNGLRVLKDLTDVAQLVLVNPIDPKAVWLRAFFEKQGNLELYERSPDFSPKETPPAYGMGTALELPDWSGHRSHHSRMPNDQWLAYCRSNLSKLRAHPGFAERRRQQGIVVEFAL